MSTNHYLINSYYLEKKIFEQGHLIWADWLTCKYYNVSDYDIIPITFSKK